MIWCTIIFSNYTPERSWTQVIPVNNQAWNPGLWTQITHNHFYHLNFSLSSPPLFPFPLPSVFLKINTNFFFFKKEKEEDYWWRTRWQCTDNKQGSSGKKENCLRKNHPAPQKPLDLHQCSMSKASFALSPGLQRPCKGQWGCFPGCLAWKFYHEIQKQSVHSPFIFPELPHLSSPQGTPQKREGAGQSMTRAHGIQTFSCLKSPWTKSRKITQSFQPDDCLVTKVRYINGSNSW